MYLELLLAEHGHRIVNLGPCVPDDLLLDSAARLRPDALVLSSVNGHAHLDGERLVRRLRADPRCAGLPAVIGGKLGVSGDDREHAEHLRAAGFDLVYPHGGGAADLGGDLQRLVDTTRRAAVEAA